MSLDANLREHRRIAGFTLIELLVVMAIIGILAGLILGVGGFAIQKARQASTTTEMEQIAKELDEFMAKYGVYPETQQAVEEYLAKRNLENVDWEDSWGRPYMYERLTKQSYRLTSKGRNESNPGDDIDASKLY